MSRVLFDLRYAARKFIRTPWLTLALLLSIGLGIGGNVSVFGFARGLTRVDSPLASLGRIVSIFGQGERGEAGPLTYGEYLSLKRDIHIFEWIGAARVQPASIGMADQSAVLSVAAVTSNLARALGLPVQQGVVISRRMWRNQFGAKNAIAGEHILINGVKTRMSGVAPERLEELYRGRAIDIWAPLEDKDLTEAEGVSRNFWVLARLLPNYSIRQAQDAVRPSHGHSGPIVLRPYTGVVPEMEQLILRIATLFGFAAGAVFFVACANVAFFLLGRAFACSYETSVRIALGANRRQLASELFCDSLVISLAGGAAGLLLAFWTSHIVPALLSDQDAEQLLFSSGFANIAVASTAGAAGMILCGLIPLFVERHNRPAAVLNRESAGPSKASLRVRACLVLLQAAVCSMLVISTAYLVSCLHAALETGSARLGNSILVTVQAQPIAGVRYFQHVQQAVQSMDGISETAWAGSLPGAQPAWRTFRIEQRDLPLRDISMDTAWFTSDSLKLFRLPPKSGRMFGFEDQTCRVAVVNTAASAQLFGSETPGRTIQNPEGLPVKIVGVVETVNERRPAIYYNTGQPGPAPALARDQRFRAPVPSTLPAVELDVNVVSQSYFAAMGVAAISGQDFTHPPASGECRIAVVNQEAARLYFGNQPVGAAVIDDRGARTAIAGVVDAKPLAAFERHAEPAIYSRCCRTRCRA